MTLPSTSEIVDAFARKIEDRLDPDKLDGPVRLDNTHTVVIIPLKGKGPIHAHLPNGVGEEGVANVIGQIEKVPSLAGLVVGR
jgi:hypothetical protein